MDVKLAGTDYYFVPDNQAGYEKVRKQAKIGRRF